MNPWIIVGFLSFLIASNGFTAYFANDYGQSREKAKWETRENEQLVKANKSILDISTRLRAAEFKHATLLSEVSTKYQKELKDAQTKHQKDIASIRAGTLRLYDSSACQGSGGATTAKAGSTSGGCPGGKRGQFLSKSASVFLVSEANRADEIVLQLKACQQVIRADRE